MASTNVGSYFDSIKNNHAALRQFFSFMPKGGDLHNHLTGSAYAETFFEMAIDKELFVNLETGQLYNEKPSDSETLQLKKDMPELHKTRMWLIDKWSIRNFEPYKYPLGPDEYFFGKFGLLAPLTTETKDLARLAHELKMRASRENVQYLELIGIAPTIPTDCFLGDEYDSYDAQLKEFAAQKNEVDPNLLCTLYNKVINTWERNETMKQCVEEYYNTVVEIDRLSNDMKIFTDCEFTDPSSIVCRYQGYAVRSLEPLMVLAQLYVVAKACKKGSPMVGCNLVAAENGEKSMSYYLLHMFMLGTMRNRYNTNIALHAGELTMGLVRPEHLTYHIHRALMYALPNRIGHGVDLPFEICSAGILTQMKKDNIPVEINLTSNEFILGVKDDEHPVRLYTNNGVPVIISTDDPGILRTSLTEQYTLLVKRYGYSYNEIKTMVYNSIKYSFLDGDTKNNLTSKLDSAFVEFEKAYKA
jgi:putative adenosine deaminase